MRYQQWGEKMTEKPTTILEMNINHVNGYVNSMEAHLSEYKEIERYLLQTYNIHTRANSDSTVTWERGL